MKLKILVQSGKGNIQTPSKIQPELQISHSEFTANYADSARVVALSKNMDGSNARQVTAYHGPKGHVIVK